MWPFSRSITKNELAEVKTIHINSFKFKIRKINPILDFSQDKMPQIFTDFISRRQRKEENTFETSKRNQMDMYAMIEAGLVDPALVKVGLGDLRGKEEGLTIEDLFRDSELGIKLYFEILTHSLNRFKGLKGVFFSIRLKRNLLMSWRNVMESDPTKLPSQQEVSA